jgi:hypothetical protein
LTEANDTPRTVAEVAAVVQQLLDRNEVEDVLARYAVAIQERDPERAASCFTSDATINYGSGDIQGLSAIRDYFDRSLSQLRAGEPLGVLEQTLLSMPVIGSVHIAVLDGTIEVRHACLAIHAGRANERDRILINGTTNDDRFVPTSDGWKIQRRVHTTQWSVNIDGTVGGHH